MRKINVLQFICPTGFYGAERWVLALNNNLDSKKVRSFLAVTKEANSVLEIVKYFHSDEGRVFEIEAGSRFSLSALGCFMQVKTWPTMTPSKPPFTD